MGSVSAVENSVTFLVREIKRQQLRLSVVVRCPGTNGDSAIQQVESPTPALQRVGNLLRHGAGLGHTRVRRHRQLELAIRSEEHTSELQSRSDLVCRLLLEKKKI